MQDIKLKIEGATYHLAESIPGVYNPGLDSSMAEQVGKAIGRTRKHQRIITDFVRNGPYVGRFQLEQIYVAR